MIKHQFSNSPELLKTLWENFPNPVLVADQNGEFIFANEAFGKALGYSAQELMECSARELSHPDEVDRDHTELKKLLHHEIQVYSVDKRYRRRDGVYVWFHLNARKVSVVDLPSEYIVGCLNDIDHRKSVTESILAQFEGQLSIINSSNYAIIGTDMEGMISSFNPAAERMLNYTAEEIVDSCNFNLFLDLFETFEHVQALNLELKMEIEPGFPAVIAKAKMFGGDESQWTLVDKNRHRHIVSLATTPRISLSGHQDGFLFIARDISVQMILQSKLEEQRVRLINSTRLASLGEMAAGMAHEINNPLAIIIGKADRMLQILSMENPEIDKAKKELGKMKTTAHRIAKIVSGLRSFSRSGEMDQLEVIDCDQIVFETLGLCAEKFRNNSVRIETQVAANCLIDCRATQISQVLLNLLNNSYDAIEKQQDKWIKVIVVSFDNTVELRVTDSGSGIPESVAQRLMEPFFTTKEIGKGTGLGLSISRGIVSAHRGKIYLDRESSNTSFVIELPKSQISPASLKVG